LLIWALAFLVIVSMRISLFSSLAAVVFAEELASLGSQRGTVRGIRNLAQQASNTSDDHQRTSPAEAGHSADQLIADIFGFGSDSQKSGSHAGSHGLQPAGNHSKSTRASDDVQTAANGSNSSNAPKDVHARRNHSNSSSHGSEPSKRNTSNCTTNCTRAVKGNASTHKSVTTTTTTTTTTTNLRTGTYYRLHVRNRCASQPVWIAHMAGQGSGPDTQNVKIEPNGEFNFSTPDGLSSTRYWPKFHCGSDGNGCEIGDSGGPEQVCDGQAGCAPPVDTKFEATFGIVGLPCDPSAGKGQGCDWVDVSLVDGFTAPFTFEIDGECHDASGKVMNAAAKTVNCSTLALDDCPAGEEIDNIGQPKKNVTVDLRVRHPRTKQVTGCYAPCSKLTLKQWGNSFADPHTPQDADVAPYCCPTPPESPEACREGPVGSTKYVQSVHDMCPGVYGYSYDDGMGLITCNSRSTYKLTLYCPTKQSSSTTASTTTVRTTTTSTEKTTVTTSTSQQTSKNEPHEPGRSHTNQQEETTRTSKKEPHEPAGRNHTNQQEGTTRSSRKEPHEPATSALESRSEARDAQSTSTEGSSSTFAVTSQKLTSTTAGPTAATTVRNSTTNAEAGKAGKSHQARTPTRSPLLQLRHPKPGSSNELPKKSPPHPSTSTPAMPVSLPELATAPPLPTMPLATAPPLAPPPGMPSACKVGDHVPCPEGLPFCSGNSCCPDLSPCPSAAEDFKCPLPKKMSCLEKTSKHQNGSIFA